LRKGWYKISTNEAPMKEGNTVQVKTRKKKEQGKIKK